jgi:hypothetical protein
MNEPKPINAAELSAAMKHLSFNNEDIKLEAIPSNEVGKRMIKFLSFILKIRQGDMKKEAGV